MTDSAGNVLNSEAARIKKPGTEEPYEKFAIVKQPEDVEGEIGETITFSIEATEAVSYQWQNSLDGESWANSNLSGSKTATISVPVTNGRYNYQWRCVVMDAKGNVLYSDSVQILKSVSDLIVHNEVTYFKIDANTLRVVSYAGTASYLEIPETVEDMTVVEIGEGAFEGNNSLTSINLPDTITKIGKRAFKNCSNLSEMN